MIIINWLVGLFKWMAALQSSVLIPLVLFTFALIARMKFSKALKSSIMVGVGFIGLMAAVGIFAQGVSPVVQDIAKATGYTKLTITDAGVFTLLLVTWGSKIAVFFIPVGLTVNLLMMWAKWTKTLDVDILNYWVWGISAIAVQTLTGSILWGIVAFIINEVVILLIADWTAPKIQEHFGLPGLSIPHGNAALWPPVGIAVASVLRFIPGLNRVKADPESIRKHWGLFGDPAILGFTLGIVLAIIARYSLAKILLLGVTVAAVMVIFPKMVALMMEGLVPISDSVREFSKLHLHRKNVYIGLDAAVLIGYPDVLAVGIILIPIVILMAPLLPGNHVLPLADLAIATPFLVSATMPFLKKGNIVWGVIAGTVIFILALYISGDLAPLYTKAGLASGIAAVPKNTTWTSVGAGSNWVTWIIVKVFKLFGY